VLGRDHAGKRQLLDLIERIGKAGAAFRSLGDPFSEKTHQMKEVPRPRGGQWHAHRSGKEAIKRRAAGETLASIAKSYGVDISMISRL
jgi:hypothetical protein